MLIPFDHVWSFLLKVHILNDQTPAPAMDGGKNFVTKCLESPNVYTRDRNILGCICKTRVESIRGIVLMCFDICLRVQMSDVRGNLFFLSNSEIRDTVARIACIYTPKMEGWFLLGMALFQLREAPKCLLVRLGGGWREFVALRRPPADQSDCRTVALGPPWFDPVWPTRIHPSETMRMKMGMFCSRNEAILFFRPSFWK